MEVLSGQPPTSPTQPPEHPESFSRDAFKAAPWMVVSKILGVLLYLPISIMIVRMLSPVDFGIYSFCTNTVQYLITFCTLGLSSVVLRFIPELMVKNNVQAVVSLINKSIFLQLITIFCFGLFFRLYEVDISKWFQFDFHKYVLAMTMLLVVMVGKDFLNNVLTSLYLAKTIAVASLLQGFTFLFLLIGLWFVRPPSPRTIINMQSLSFIGALALSGIVLIIFMNKHKNGHHHKGFGIGRKRVLGLAIPTMLDQVLIKLRLQYSEIFFLGLFYGPALVGFFSLGFFLSQQLITLIPFTLQTLLLSAFAESYTKNPHSLPKLMRGLYVLLILICIPIAGYGFFFFEPACIFFYGERMALAGTVGAIFCVVHFMSLFSIPLQFAIIVKEKAVPALWLTILELVVNLVLDYYLIKEFAIWGCVYAIASSFILTLPARIWFIRRIIGGIYFPVFFLTKFALLTTIWGGIVWLIIPYHEAFLSLVASFLLYSIGFLALTRYSGILSEHDIHLFKNMNFKKLNRFLDYLIGVRKA